MDGKDVSERRMRGEQMGKFEKGSIKLLGRQLIFHICVSNKETWLLIEYFSYCTQLFAHSPAIFHYRRN